MNLIKVFAMLIDVVSTTADGLIDRYSFPEGFRTEGCHWLQKSRLRYVLQSRASMARAARRATATSAITA